MMTYFNCAALIPFSATDSKPNTFIESGKSAQKGNRSGEYDETQEK